MFGSQEQLNWNNHFSSGFGEGGGNSDTKWLEPDSCFQLQLLGLLRLQAPFFLRSHTGELLS